MASPCGGPGAGLGWRRHRAGVSLARARAAAVGGAGPFAELLEAGSAAALLLAVGLGHGVVVTAVVTEAAATDPGDGSSNRLLRTTPWAAASGRGLALVSVWDLGTRRSSSYQAHAPDSNKALWVWQVGDSCVLPGSREAGREGACS